MPKAPVILIVHLLLLPLAALAAKKDESQDISRFWSSDSLHVIRLRVTAQQWQMTQPIRKGQIQHISASSMPPPAGKPSTQPVLMPLAPSTQPVQHVEGERLDPNFYGLEFAYVKADFECDGVAVKDIGFRQRGNSSYGWAQGGLKRPFKVDFNHFVDTQKFLGMGSFYLNNNAYDPSFMRETLSYEVFRKLGVAAPRTTYALVYLTIEGKCENELLGLYTLIETMDSKSFLKAHFASAKGMLMKPWSIRGLPYLGEQWEKYEPYYAPRTDPTPAGARRTIDFIKLVNYADDATFRREIADYLDVDEYLRLLAGDVMLANLDTFLYTGHNFYLYLNPKDNLLHFMPWDMNLSFANYTSTGSIDQQVHLSIMHPHSGEAKIIDRLLAMPQYADAYRGHIKRAIETFFNPQAMNARIDALQSVLAKADAAADEAWRANYLRSHSSAATQPSKIPPRPIPRLMGWQGEPAIPLKTFMVERVDAINAQLAGQSDGFSPGGRRYPQPPPGGLRANAAYGALPMIAFGVLRNADSDYDNKLNRSECVSAVKAFFESADSSHRGWLDQASLTQALARGLKQLPNPRRGNNTPPRPADPEAWRRAIFMAVDSEKTGRITLAQAVAATEGTFARFDKDKSGRIDGDELVVLLDSLAAAAPPPRPPEPPRRALAATRPAATRPSR